MKKIIAAFFVLIFAGCASSPKKKTPYNFAKTLYEEAWEFYKEKRYDDAIKKLDSIIMIKEEEVSFLPDALYLKAYIYVELAKSMKNPMDYDLILKQFRDEKFNEKYIMYYTLALRNLSTIVIYFPDDDLAPKAMLLQGNIYDYENLQMFSQAISLYTALINKFPDSEEGISAKKRVEELQNIIEGIESSPHGIKY